MHKIDTSLTYSTDNLPKQREIENPEVDPVPETNPPIITISEEPYIPSNSLKDVVNLAIALGRPLLLQGDPGCGKTRLAHSIAFALGLPLEQAYIKSTSRAQDLLYQYDAVRRLYDAQLGKEAPINEATGKPLVRNIREYIQLGPLGRAIVRAQHKRRSVVLIDEIDKADLDFPNDLLWELDRLEFRVTEAPDMHYAAGDLRPIIVITHNEEKPLPSAFLRRCIFHYLEFPTDLAEIDRILKLHDVNNQTLRTEAIQVVQNLRKMDMSKKPGLSELIDWVSYQQAMHTKPSVLQELPNIEALVKQRSDQERARREFKSQ